MNIFVYNKYNKCVCVSKCVHERASACMLSV